MLVKLNWPPIYFQPLSLSFYFSLKLPNVFSVSNTSTYSTRSCTCGELRLSDIDKTVVLCGWVQYVRGTMFLVLRDAYGQVQIIVPQDVSLSI